jgi:hypothetical protein
MRRRSSATSSRRSAGSLRVLAAAAAVAFGSLRSEAQPPVRPTSRSTDHLTVSATLAPLTISIGQRVVLTTEVKPKAGMHVYAPGSQYRAVAITLATGSPFRLEAPLEYPKPLLYTFKPLSEQVLVYNAPFRLVAHLGLDPAKPLVTPPQRPLTLTLNASLDYQACDDRVCYLPQSVALRWPVSIVR